MSEIPEELEARFLAEIPEFAQGDPVWHQLSRLEWYAVISLAQVATRHPEVQGWVPQMGTAALRRVTRALAPEGSAMREVLERGWNPRHDVPAKEQEGG